MVTEKENDPEIAGLTETEVEEEPKKAKKPKKAREPALSKFRSWRAGLPRAQRTIVTLVVVFGIVFGLIYLSAVIAMEPWYKNEFQDDIQQDSQWIEVTAQPFEFDSYAAEGETWIMPFDFPTNDEEGKYVAEFTFFLIWVDDARTGPDTFNFRVINADGVQTITGGGAAGQAMMRARLNNTAIKHNENYRGWTIEVTCQEAKDGYLGPGGWITIPDDGNDFKARFEWSYFIELNPDWE